MNPTHGCVLFLCDALLETWSVVSTILGAVTRLDHIRDSFSGSFFSKHTTEQLCAFKLQLGVIFCCQSQI